MIAAIIILVYTSIGLATGAVMWCLDKMIDGNKLDTTDMWFYLVGHTILWPLSLPANIYDTVQDSKGKSDD